MILSIFLLLVLHQAASVRAAGAVCDGQALGQIPTLKGTWVSRLSLLKSGIFEALSMRLEERPVCMTRQACKTAIQS